jgi:hypothetical protein
MYMYERKNLCILSATERNNMKATKFIIEKQQDALVEVIQFLDANGHSDTEVRETVDRILNSRSFDEVKEDSDKEIQQAEEVLKRYEYAD